MGEEQESRKTPVDPKIKPDPKEKDLSGIPVRQPAPHLSPDELAVRKFSEKKDKKPEDKPINGTKTTAKLTTVFSDVIG